MTLDPKRTAFTFPGQGSQAVGMGKALAEAFPEARDAFAEADSVLGFPLSKMCWEGPEAELGDTYNTQPALLAHSVAAWRALTARLGGFAPVCVAGHSLGEFSALVAAGALDYADALRLTRERGRLMKEAGVRQPGGMAAILNLDAGALAEACREAAAETGGLVQLANDNSPGQAVISGDVAALERAMALATARGAKRAIRLNVSIASHSPLMAEAAAAFAKAVDSTPMRDARAPLFGNTSASAIAKADDLRAEIKAQLTSPVRWVESVRAMASLGAAVYVELGSKDVLTNLLKRIDPQARGIACGAPAEIDAALGV